jgi:DNA repair exonuclease SbcCD ATPase subunit
VKLRAIELVNVRRFAGQRARLAGLGDGLTVLCEPNESGKSTFFDALRALFFEKHRGNRKSIQLLKPHAGGAPEVSAVIEVEGARFTLAKRWITRPTAMVTDAMGRLIAQEDEAEAWIARLTGAGLAGPSGLLWVRQGVSDLEPSGKSDAETSERDRLRATRRNLMSSVAGEIEAMTGGRRMDAVQEAARVALAALATDTGKPRAGGPWKAALDEAEALGKEEALLRGRAKGLTDDLAARAKNMKKLNGLDAPAEVEARAAALRAATGAHRAADAYAGRVRDAEQKVALAERDAKAAEADLNRLTALADRLDRARGALDAAAEAARKATEAADRLTRKAEEVETAASDAAGRADALRERLALAQRARAAAEARASLDGLRERVRRGAELRDEAETTRAARALIGVTPDAVAAADRAQEALDRAQALAEAQTVILRFRHDGALRARLDGADLDESPLPVTAPCTIDLPGLGALHVDPGAGRGEAADVAAARAALTLSLDACGAESMAAARKTLETAAELDRRLATGADLLAIIAPDGIEALRRALAGAEAVVAAVPDEDPGEDPATLEADLKAAEQHARTTAAAAAATRKLVHAARVAAAGAGGECKGAGAHLRETEAEAGDPAALPAALEAQREVAARARGHAAALAESAASLRAAAPDLETARANLNRAQTSADNAVAEGGRLRETLAEINARIDMMAGQGIEERLAEVEGLRAAAEARAARYEAEVRALTRLREALETARAAARDAYFAPVVAELQPLLAILHPGAALRLDDASLLPATLTRDGQGEALDILSGGTREQIAVLTRLAFARLFARAGRPVPVILDDALVHSDDDRIEAMFTALHRAARDQQIIVLTCRQRAFATLGGTRARLEVTPLG